MKCVVPTCDGKGFVFKVPSDRALLDRWQEALPFNILLTPNSDLGICESHFHPSCVTRKTTSRDKSGKVLFHTYYEYPKLADNVVPSIFSKLPNCDLNKKFLIKGCLVNKIKLKSPLKPISPNKSKLSGQKLIKGSAKPELKVLVHPELSTFKVINGGKQEILLLNKVKGLLPIKKITDGQVNLEVKDTAPTFPSSPSIREILSSTVLENSSEATDTGETLGTAQLRKERKKKLSSLDPSKLRSSDILVPSTVSESLPHNNVILKKSLGNPRSSASTASSTLESDQRTQKEIHQEPMNVDNCSSCISNLDEQVNLGVKDAAPTLHSSPTTKHSSEFLSSSFLDINSGVMDSGETLISTQLMKERGHLRILDPSREIENKQSISDGLAPSSVPESLPDNNVISKESLTGFKCSTTVVSSLSESAQRTQEEIIHQEPMSVDNCSSSVSNLDIEKVCEVLNKPPVKRVYRRAKSVKRPLQATLSSQNLENSASAIELPSSIINSRLTTLPEICPEDTTDSGDISLCGYSSLKDKEMTNLTEKILLQTAKKATLSVSEFNNSNNMKEASLPENPPHEGNVNSNLAENSLHFTAKKITSSPSSKVKTPISRLGNKNKNNLEVNRALNFRLKKNVYVVPLKDVISQPLSKKRVQKIVVEQFGVNVPFSSKLFKVFYNNIRRFKANYEKKINNAKKRPTDQNKRKLSDISLKGKKKRAYTKNKDLNNLNHPCEDPVICDKLSSNSATTDRKNLSASSRKKYNSLSEASNTRLKDNQNIKIAPRNYEIKFLGTRLKKAAIDGQLNGDHCAQSESIFEIPTSITNVNDKSQLDILYQTFINTLHELHKYGAEGTEVKLVVSIIKTNEVHSSSKVDKGFASDKTVIRRRSKNCSKTTIHNSERIMSLGSASLHAKEKSFDIQSTATKKSNFSAGINSLTVESSQSMCGTTNLVSNSNGTPLCESNSHFTVSTEKNTDIVDTSNSSFLPMKAANKVNIYQEHSYSPDSCSLFKNNQLIDRTSENTEKGKLHDEIKVFPSRHLIQNYEKEKKQFQKDILKLTAKVKSKNLQILEKNRKIKYLSNIICNEKGVKQIKYSEDGSKSKLSSPISASTIPLSYTYLQFKNHAKSRGQTQVSLPGEDKEDLMEDDGQYSADYFERRFTEIYQSLNEIS